MVRCYNKTLPKEQILRAYLSWTLGYQPSPTAGNSEPFPQVVPEDHSPSPLEQYFCSDYTVTLLNQVSNTTE